MHDHGYKTVVLQTLRSDVLRAVSAYIQELSARPTVADISRQNRLLEEQILQTLRSDVLRAVSAYIQELSARPTVADISRQNRLLEAAFANITLRRPPSGVGVHPGALGAADRRRHKSAKPPARGAE
ncbi:hypothetical protein EVAR_96400_1 [Eumeta japonica]|uniref:Uncharacterized protein n=1 Tax=Eumeta variegata TaxID=151549 RepID=A0A4C1WD10_EUMVA|nr:hypothetical protein EVAR_96400_1 [Eumeta japonica]